MARKPYQFTGRPEVRGCSPRRTQAGAACVPAPAAPSPKTQLQAALQGAKGKRPLMGPEDLFQEEAVQTLRLILPEPCRVWFCPNGQGRFGPAYAHRLTRLGLLGGVHDVHVIWPGGFGTLEFKRKDGKGRASKGQDSFGEAMAACGHPSVFVESLEAVVDTVASWVEPAGVVLRADLLQFRGPR